MRMRFHAASLFVCLIALNASISASGKESVAPTTLPDFLGKTLVEVERPFSDQGKQTVLGWRGQDSHGAERVWFADGWSMPAPKGTKSVDLVEETERFLHELRAEWDKPQPTKEEWQRAKWSCMGPATRASWLRHLGRDALADAVEAEGWPTLEPRDMLDYNPLRAIEWACTAFRGGDDARALFHMRNLRDHFAADFTASGAKPLLDDLERREKAGELGRAFADKPPVDFPSWSTEQKVAWLVGQMDVYPGSSSNVVWFNDELRKLGEPAIPFLLAATAKDTRLTRSTWYRDGITSPVVLCPAEARGLTLYAVSEAIGLPFQLMRVAPWPERKGGFDVPDDAVAEAKRYWETHHTMPREDRYLTGLMEEHPEIDANTRAWLFEAILREHEAKAPRPVHPLVARYPDDRVARFVLSLHDELIAELVERYAKPFETKDAYFYSQIQRSPGRAVSTMDDLIALGDKRVLPDLKNRAAAAPTPLLRAHIARACAALGDLEPARELATELAKGTLELPAGTAFGYPEFAARVPGSEVFAVLENLDAWADKLPDMAVVAGLHHPFHDALAIALVEPNESVRFFHGVPKTVFLTLATELEVLDKTGVNWSRKRDSNGDPEVWIVGRRPGIQYEWRRFLPDPDGELDLSLSERRCDCAAATLTPFLLGVPPYAAFHPERDQRLADLRSFMALHGRRLRLASDLECIVLGDPSRYPCYVSGRVRLPSRLYLPNFEPLDQPATATELAAGVAVFHLQGNAKHSNMKLPQAGRLKAVADAWNGPPPDMLRAEPPKEFPRAGCLIVQAEEDTNGQRWYGIVTHDGIRQVKAEEVLDVTPLPAGTPAHSVRFEAPWNWIGYGIKPYKPMPATKP